MTIPTLDACPHCGNENVYCYTHILDVDGVEKKCTECGETFDLGEAVRD